MSKARLVSSKMSVARSTGSSRNTTTNPTRMGRRASFTSPMGPNGIAAVRFAIFRADRAREVIAASATAQKVLERFDS